MRNRFAERIGLVAPRQPQRDDMDPSLRNRLEHLVFKFCPPSTGVANRSFLSPFGEKLCEELGVSKFDRRSIYIDERIQDIFANDEWFSVLNLVEFAAASLQDRGRREFIKQCNVVLEAEVSAYRFVGAQIVPLTDDTQIADVTKAQSNPHAEVAAHLKKAERLLSTRPKTDYVNVIKESISAAEAMARVVARNPSATLGEALKAIKQQKNARLHPVLIDAFSKLYGWTSNDGGIRHAAKPVSPDNALIEPDEALARYMFVTCSAFVNYLESSGFDVE